jgi:hypothetical protein
VKHPLGRQGQFFNIVSNQPSASDSVGSGIFCDPAHLADENDWLLGPIYLTADASNMKIFLSCMLFGLLVSCDKPAETASESADEGSNLRTTRANRPPREAKSSPKKELKDAIAAALAMDPLEAREQALAEIVRSEFEQNPEIANEALEHLAPGGEERAKTLRFIASYLVQKNKDEALAWEETLSSSEDKAIAKDEITAVLGAIDPVGAAKMVLEPRTGNQALSENEVSVLQNWIGSAPAEAAVWVQKLPPGEAQKTGVKTLLSQWVQMDASAAFAWTAAIRNPTARKQATRAMAESLVETPEPIRNFLLEGADPAIRAEIDPLVNQITQEAAESLPVEPE